MQYVQTVEGTNTIFPISAYDPINPAQILLIANWGDGSQESVVVSRNGNRDREYYYEFNKTYEFPGTYNTYISAARISSALPGTSKQLATYQVTVESNIPADPLPVLKIADISNFVDYSIFYLNIDDDGVSRSWANKQLTIPVLFGTTIIGYISAVYGVDKPGTIGITLTANQVSVQNWPLKTKLPFEVIERDTGVTPPVITSLFKGYVYVYEATTKSAIFL